VWKGAVLVREVDLSVPRDGDLPNEEFFVGALFGLLEWDEFSDICLQPFSLP